MKTKTIQTVVDNKGHYDLDGVSYDTNHVTVASDQLSNPSKDPLAKDPLSKSPLANLGPIEKIEEEADKNSLKLQNKKKNDQVYSAKYHSEFIDFLKYEKAGD